MSGSTAVALKIDPENFLSDLGKMKQNTPPSTTATALLVEFLSEPKVKKGVGDALKAGYKRSAIAELIRKQRPVSIPTIRKAIDIVFPRTVCESTPTGASKADKKAEQTLGKRTEKPPTVPMPTNLSSHQASRRAEY